jgi:hypothetical protein
MDDVFDESGDELLISSNDYKRENDVIKTVIYLCF